jgi:hypothetical protein
MPWEGSGWSHPRNEIATDAKHRDEALRYMLAHPARTVASWPGKLRHTFMQDYNYVEHFSLAPREQAMPPTMNGRVLNWIADLYYFAVLGLTFVGLGVAWHTEARRVLIPVGVVMVAPTMVFFGLDRFHVAMIPVMAALAGVALSAAIDAARVLRRVPLPRLRLGAPGAEGLATRGSQMGAD